jgi:multiple RNA-binding domain-containing protein 1
LSGGDILDADGVGGGELAVRLAIGETHILQDNREYFLSHGVDIDILESALQNKKKDTGKGVASSEKKSSVKEVKRSGTTILIKNLPHDLNAEELEDMFARCVNTTIITIISTSIIIMCGIHE